MLARRSSWPVWPAGPAWPARLRLLFVLICGSIFLTSCVGQSADANSNEDPCSDHILSETGIETTLFYLASEREYPSVESETIQHIPSEWRGTSDVIAPPGSERRALALNCLLSDSVGRQTEVPSASIDANASKPVLNVKDRAEVRDADLVSSQWLVGPWTLDSVSSQEKMSLWSRNTFGQDISTEVTALPGDVVAHLTVPQLYQTYAREVSPMAPSAKPSFSPFSPLQANLASLDVTLEIADANVVQSVMLPDHYDQQSTHWSLKSVPKAFDFWVVIRPKPLATLPVVLAQSKLSWLPTLFNWSGWILFGVIAGWLTYRSKQVLDNILGAKARVDLILLLGLIPVSAMLRAASDLFWAHRGLNTGPGDLPYRLENVAFALLSTLFAARFLTQGRFSRLIVLATGSITALAYVTGPRFGFTMSGLHPGSSPFDYDAWRLYGTAAASVGLFALLICSLLVACRNFLLSQMSPPKHYFNRRFAAAAFSASFAVATIIALENGNWISRDRDLRSPNPIGLSYLDLSIDSTLGSLVWVSDFLLLVTPLLSFYCLAFCLLMVLRKARSLDDPELPRPLLDLFIFCIAALCVGIFGSYRSIVFPIALMVTWLALHNIVKGRIERAKQALCDLCSGSSVNVYSLTVARRRLLSSASANPEAPSQPIQTSRLNSRRRSQSSKTSAWPSTATETGLTTPEKLVLIGPRLSAYSNAVYGGSLAIVAAIPLTAYDVATRLRDGGVTQYLESNTGLTDAIAVLLFEVTHWASLGIALGLLWRILPGGRGVYKGLVLSIPIILGFAADDLVSAVLGQASWAPYDLGTWSAIAFVLTTLGLLMDLACLRQVDEWDIWSIVRLRSTKWLPAYGAAVALIALNITKTIMSGEPITTIPEAVLSTFTRQ